MKKIILLGVLLATGGCQGMYQRLGMMREEETTASDTHRTWFKSFVDAVNNEEEEWDALDKVLDEGQRNQQLGVTVTWPEEGQETGCEYTPLHYAAAQGNLEVVRALINNMGVPADIRTSDKRSTPLHLAASRGHLDVVKLFVEKGAEVDGTDAEGSSALHYAAAGQHGENSRDIVEYLIERGADFKKSTRDGISPLGFAVFSYNIPVVECWIDTFSHDSDPEVVTLTKKYLNLAKFLKDREPIVRMLKKFLKEKSH